MFGKKKESINGFTQQALELAKAQVRKQIDDTPFFKYGDKFYMVVDQVEWYDSKMIYIYKGVVLYSKETDSTYVWTN